jgi:hypothetical protein
MAYVIQGIRGKEFLQVASSCHKVSKASGKIIADILNNVKFKLDDEHIWLFYDSVVPYGNCRDYASFQEFKLRKGGQVIREVVR